MNYTFLPQYERSRLKTEYRVRALVVLTFVMSVSVIIGVVSLFPTFIFSKIEEKNQLSMIAETNKKNDESGLSDIKAKLTKSNLLLSKAEESLKAPVYSSVVKDIINAKGVLKIDSISFTNSSTSTVDVFVQGFSANRENLLAFKDRLESIFPGKSIDLPLSDLAKNRDIKFSLKFPFNI